MSGSSRGGRLSEASGIALLPVFSLLGEDHGDFANKRYSPNPYDHQNGSAAEIFSGRAFFREMFCTFWQQRAQSSALYALFFKGSVV